MCIRDSFQSVWLFHIFSLRPVLDYRSVSYTHLQQASHYHYSKASFMLGYMYHYGDGISKDLEKAKEYYQLALQEGYLSLIHIY